MWAYLFMCNILLRISKADDFIFNALYNKISVDLVKVKMYISNYRKAS